MNNSKTPASFSPALAVFKFQENEVRTVTRDGEPWFVAVDVCRALGYLNTSKAIGDHLDADEKANESLGLAGSPVNIISESGLYALVLRSRKPEARKFAKWVTGEVLPAIRKTGKFEAKATAGPLTIEMRNKIKSMVVQKLDAMQYTAAIALLAKMQVNWELVDDEPAAKKYHFPLELADPHDRWCGNAWMTPRVLLDTKNRPLELELIEQLEKDGHDVTGVKVRIVAMRQNMEQTEEAKEILRYLHDRLGPLVEKTKVGLIERGKNVLFSSKPNPDDPIERHVFASQL